MAKRTFLADIDLNKNQLLNAKLHNLAVAPTLGAGDVGYVYYDTATAHSYIWNGSAWLQLQDTSVATQIHSAGGKSTVVDADEFGLVDSEESYALKKKTYAELKANLKAYFYGIYSPTGVLDYKGAYDASTNTPDLDTSPSGVKIGDTYTVTVAGTFFTEAVQVGDMLIAEANDAN